MQKTAPFPPPIVQLSLCRFDSINSLYYDSLHTMRTLVLALLLAVLAFARASLPTKPSVSASIKDNKVQSSDGFNLNIAIPFKFDDVLFGFRYAFDNSKIAPDSLFFRKSVETGSDGTLTVDGDYLLRQNKLGMAARWVSKQLGLDVGADLDTQNYLTKVDLSKSMSVDEKKVTLSGAYDLRKSTGAAGVDVKVEATNLALSYDGEDQDVTFSVSHEVDANNVVTPSVKSSKQVGLAVLHKWQGGQVKAQYSYPGDKLNIEWKDVGTGGSWLTKAEVPIRNAKQSKVSLSRDWTY